MGLSSIPSIEAACAPVDPDQAQRMPRPWTAQPAQRLEYGTTVMREAAPSLLSPHPLGKPVLSSPNRRCWASARRQLESAQGVMAGTLRGGQREGDWGRMQWACEKSREEPEEEARNWARESQFVRMMADSMVVASAVSGQASRVEFSPSTSV